MQATYWSTRNHHSVYKYAKKANGQKRVVMRSTGWLVLNFHGIGEPPPGISVDEQHHWCATDTFLRILDSIPEVEERSGVRIGLTFDDGKMSDAQIAMPALAERELRGTFFPCAGRIGEPGYLDGPAMVEILSAGMEIGTHGWSHVDWRRADDWALARETKDARDRIAQVIQRPVETVAIPFGSYDRRFLGRLRTYRTIYTSDGYRTPRLGRIIPRVTYMTSWDTHTLLRAATEPYSVVRQLHNSLKHLIKRLR